MPELNLSYVPSMQMGYGRAGVSIAREMRKAGVTVYDNMAGTERSDVLMPDAQTGRSNVACWISQPTHVEGWWKGQVPVMFTMWESMRLPEAVTDTLDAYDTVIVPSPQNLELFAERHPNVKYVPLGIDPIDWCYRERTAPTTEFNFLIGGSGERKGVDLAYRAFMKLWGKEDSWGDGPVPHLLLKAPRAEQYYGSRVHQFNGKLTAADEIGLYAQAHCYLQPSRGEGFGLQPLQAIAQGCPTILTGAHGHASYAHLGMPLDSAQSKSGYFMLGDAGEWWEPDFDQLCESMQFVYDNYDAACAHAKAGSEIALRDFTWERSANGILDAIGRDRLGPYEGPDEWFAAERKLYPVVTIKDHHCNVGGVNHFFRKGEEYWQPADVKRVLFEAGYLDPACLGDDGAGLAAQQVERLGLYRAEHAICPTCAMPVNR